MASIANFIIDMLVYDDSSATNDPQQRIWDYKKQLSRSNFSNPSVQKLVLTGDADTSITIPADPTKFLFIETDQTINLLFSGGVEEFVTVSPTAAGTSNGLFFKTGNFSALEINVPGVVSANVKIFMGV